MAEESDLERTEPASSRRLEQARQEGQVPRSREIGAFMVLMVAAGAFWMIGGWMMQRTSAIVRRGLTFDGQTLRDPQSMLARFSEISLDALLAVGPLILALIVAALIAPFFLGSWNFSFKALTPDIGRLNPLKGLSRIISWTGLLELVKSVAKASLIDRRVRKELNMISLTPERTLYLPPPDLSQLDRSDALGSRQGRGNRK